MKKRKKKRKKSEGVFRKMVNKIKGFTMIELLATITILGILSLIAVGSINVFIQRGKNNYYSAQRNNLISAAKSYYQANRSKLPKSVGLKEEVTLKKLQENKFIGKVYDASKKECNAETTKVEVVKTSNSYKYKSYLDCPGLSDTASASETTVVTVTYTKTGGIVTLVVNSTNTKIKSYSYTVLKNESNYVGPVTGKGNSKTLDLKTFKIDLTENNKNYTFKANVDVVDEYGNPYSASTKIDINDTNPPKCVVDMSNLPAWGAGPQTIKASCLDEVAPGDAYASGCQKDVYSVTLKNDSDAAKHTSINMLDKAGNKVSCSIKSAIRIDTEPPTCPTVSLVKSDGGAYSSGTWITGTVNTSASGSVDAGVGGVYYKLVTSGATGTRTGEKASSLNVTQEGKSVVTYQACDSMNHCTNNCTSYNINQDRSGPTGLKVAGYATSNPNATSNAGLGAYGGGWLSGYVFTLPYGASDAGVGGIYYQRFNGSVYTNSNYFTVSAEGGVTTYYRACDALGNCSGAATIATYLDRTPPTYVSYTTKKTGKSGNRWTHFYLKFTDSAGLKPINRKNTSGVMYYCYNGKPGGCSNICTNSPSSSSRKKIGSNYYDKAQIDDNLSSGTTDTLEIKTSDKCAGKSSYDVKLVFYACDGLNNCAWLYDGSSPLVVKY